MHAYSCRPTCSTCLNNTLAAFLSYMLKHGFLSVLSHPSLFSSSLFIKSFTICCVTRLLSIRVIFYSHKIKAKNLSANSGTCQSAVIRQTVELSVDDKLFCVTDCNPCKFCDFKQVSEAVKHSLLRTSHEIKSFKMPQRR